MWTDNAEFEKLFRVVATEQLRRGALSFFSESRQQRVGGISRLQGCNRDHRFGANVAFAVGPYYYLVGFGSSGVGAPTHAQLIAAAQRLYGRVRG